MIPGQSRKISDENGAALMLERPYSLLIIDDEPGICDIIDSVISRQFKNDLNLVSTTSGKEALEHLENEEFHIVVTDLNIPDHSGYDIARKAWDQSRSTQVIFVTGHVEMPVFTTCLREGAAAIIYKPINPEHLIKVVNMCMERFDFWNYAYDHQL
ncbi:MAG: response regulator [Oligoflexales bacterium]